MANLWSRFMAGARAFREAFLSGDPADVAQFGSADARMLRYELFWAYFENTAYRDIHAWAPKFRSDYGLYRYIRSIYNPAYRIGSFWRSHIMGGSLDPEAGDGKGRPSALPIVTDNAALRPALAQLWRWSNWQQQKSLYTLYGTIMGDAALRVVDDTDREKVYLQAVNPASILDVTVDPFGNVKGYVLEEGRPDPREDNAAAGGPARTVRYREVVTRDGDAVQFATLLDGAPYAWNGIAAQWEEGYGFVPLVMARHINVGGPWGWSELHPGLAKFREVDDLASKLGDQIRKTVESGWMFAGVAKPVSNPSTRGADRSSSRPEPGREEVPVLYANDPNAKAFPLVAPLDIAGTTEHIVTLLEAIESEYPELNKAIYSGGADLSARAIRTARQPVEEKAEEYRATYDDALVRAQQMAVAIGGMRGYRGFGGFGLDSYAAGKLDHAIGKRPVFANDPQDDVERETAFWNAALAATNAGLPLETFLERNGWTREELANLGTQRMAAIQLQQEDVVPQLPTGAAQ